MQTHPTLSLARLGLKWIWAWVAEPCPSLNNLSCSFFFFICRKSKSHLVLSFVGLEEATMVHTVENFDGRTREEPEKLLIVVR